MASPASHELLFTFVMAAEFMVRAIFDDTFSFSQEVKKQMATARAANKCILRRFIFVIFVFFLIFLHPHFGAKVCKKKIN